MHFELLLYATKNPIFMIFIFTENLQSRHFITILASPGSQKTSQTFPEIKENFFEKGERVDVMVHILIPARGRLRQRNQKFEGTLK